MNQINALQTAMKYEVATVKVVAIAVTGVTYSSPPPAKLISSLATISTKEEADEEMGETKRLSFIINTIINFLPLNPNRTSTGNLNEMSQKFSKKI